MDERHEHIPRKERYMWMAYDHKKFNIPSHHGNAS